MKFSTFVLAASVATLSTFASAETIGFDDLSPDFQGSVIANGYHGFDWDNFYVMKGTDFGASGYGFGTVSAPNVAFNGQANSASFSSATAFNLVSVGVTKAWEAGVTHFDGYVGNTLTYQLDVNSTTTEPTLALFSHWTGLNKVTISNATVNGGFLIGQSAIDNLTVTAVPEPESYAMLLAGLALIGGMVRRRKNTKR